MPSLYYRIDAPGINILDTVTQQVVTGLLDELDLVNLFTNAVYIAQSFSAYSQYDDGDGSVALNKNRCDVVVNYIMDKSQVPWPVETAYTTTALGLRSDKKGNHSPVLIDQDAGIIIEHYTVACGIEMEFKMNFQTFDDACRAFDTIQSKYKGALIQSPFDISFAYPVSMGILEYLTAVYQAKTDYTTKTLLDYISDKKISDISFDIRKSQLTDVDADKELMVRCQQINCLAQLTMDQKEPDPVRVGQLPDSFTLNFSLVFQFGRPNLVVIHTPISVDNTVLPYGLFENLLINYHYNPEVTGLYSDLLVGDMMKRSYGNYRNSAQIVRSPVYDDWFVVDNQYRYYEYRPILIAHFTLDGSVTTIDLKALGDIQLHPTILAILKETGSAVFGYGGIFNIGVYANELRLGEELLSIDENLILTINSNRPDKSYHLVISETTAITKTDPVWDQLLIRYRYFFPLTIERNLEHLIEKRYFFTAFNDDFLILIGRLGKQNHLREVLTAMVAVGEITNEIFSYTQNTSQLADYLVYTQSQRTDYTTPIPLTILVDETGSPIPDPDGSLLIAVNQRIADVNTYYSEITSVFGRSLFVAFIEQCLLKGYMTLDDIPDQYIQPDQTIYPYTQSPGGFYGFNTPLRVLKFDIRPE